MLCRSMLKPVQPEEIQKRNIRELRSSLHSAKYWIHCGGYLRCHLVQRRFTSSRCFLFWRKYVLNMCRKRICTFNQRGSLLLPRSVDCLENLSKSRTSKLWLFREVGSTPERLTIGRYEHRERPTTLVSHSLQRCH